MIVGFLSQGPSLRVYSYPLAKSLKKIRLQRGFVIQSREWCGVKVLIHTEYLL